VNTSGECVSKITSSVHVFDADKKEVDLTVTGKIKDADVENYSMYACSASECTQTSGYIKINDFFEKSVGEEDDWNKNCSTNYFFFEDNNGFELFRKSNGKCVLTYDDAYRKKGTVYYFINQAGNNNSLITDAVNCMDGQEGNLSSGNVICLGIGSISKNPVEIEFKSTEEVYYLIKPKSSLFTIPDNEHAIILKQTQNIIYHDISPSGKTYIIINYYFF